MNEDIRKVRKEERDKVLVDWLSVKYPHTFNPDDAKPLAIGIGKILLDELPEGITAENFHYAMKWYTRSIAYFKAVIKNTHRFNLQGEPVEEISEASKRYANASLDAIRKKAKEKKALANEAKVIATDMTIEIEQVEPMTEEKKTLSLKSKKAESTAPQAKPTSGAGQKAQAKSLKVTLVIDPATLPEIDSTGMKKVPLEISIASGDLTVTTEINSKSYRKALSSIAEYGAENCNAIIQGSMKQYGVIDDAGLVVQQKKVAAEN